MICYLNRGLILEQAICATIEDYLEAIQIDKIFKNFHTHVTLRHPFAHLFLEKGLKAADHFPSVVISTSDEDKPPEMDGLPPTMQGHSEMDAVGITGEDIDVILDTTETVIKAGKTITRQKPGIPIVASPDAIAAIRAKLVNPTDMVYGWSVRTYRHDSISIEIWAENEQVKNQIYSDLDLFILGNLRNILIAKYESNDLKIDEESIRGQRSGAWNIDFAVVLSGANINFEVNYSVEQLLINTELKELHREIIIGGNSYA
ncbi:hypothetical protein FACS1894137_07320 [Spirochaetia bacterium]|nr:hypothetical protein FACS1894137_07320 [Spirochaetia bacterium]